MTGFAVGSPVGLERIQLFMLNADGVPVGNSAGGANPANGSTVHALDVGGGVGSAFNAREPNIVDTRSNDAFSGKVQFGGRDMQSFNVTFEEANLNVMALTNESLVDSTSNARWKIAGLNPRKVILPACGLIMSQIFQDREAAASGINQFIHHIFPIGSASLVPGAAAFQGVSEWTLNFTPTMGSKLLWGEAFGVKQAWEGNKTDYYILSSENLIALTTFVGDASETTFVTGYRPLSADIDLGDNANLYAEDGTPEALTSIVPATGVATPDAAPGAGVIGQLLYETNFVPI